MSASEQAGNRREHEVVRSEMSGSAGDVVQARDVRGGVHFHHPRRPLGPVPRQLPGDVRGFVNRDAELERLGQVVAADVDEPTASRVCVIAGTAGVGKTSLAVHWAHLMRDRFPDGQLYVNLRGYDPGPPVTPEQTLDRFLRALDVSPGAIPHELEARSALYRSLLAGRRMLVVLDNAASVGQVRPLLPGTATCLVLVTSRSRLSGLVARDGAQRLTLDVLAEEQAVALLRITTRDYRPADDPEQVAELARLCARLPLALRVAAERASSRPHLPLDALIQDLRDESTLWDLLAPDDTDEADAVRTVFAWSYRALSPDAARMFRLLGLHPGPDFCASAAAALAGTPVAAARRLLDVLVGAHLLEQPAPDRYQFHDLLRAYAADQVQQQEPSPGRESALRRVLDWYLHSADAAVAASMYRSRRFPLDPPAEGVSPAMCADHDGALRWYEQERANLVAATLAANDAGRYHIAWRIPAVLYGIYNFRHPFDDWFTTGRVGLDAARRVGDPVGEACLLNSLGKAHTQFQQPREALECHREALRLRRAAEDRTGEAESLAGAGLACLRLRRLAEARDYLERSRARAHELGEAGDEAVALHRLGLVHLELGQPDQAVVLLEGAVEKSREIGNQAIEIDVLVSLCEAQREVGHNEAAFTTVRRLLAVAADTHDDIITALGLVELGRVQQAGGRPEDALVSYQEAAVLQRRLGNRGREARAVDCVGEAYQQLGRFGEAVDFHRRAAAVHRAVDDQWGLAVALHNLATALDRLGESGGAGRAWRDALDALAEFADPRADALRTRIGVAVAGTESASDRSSAVD